MPYGPLQRRIGDQRLTRPGCRMPRLPPRVIGLHGAMPHLTRRAGLPLTRGRQRHVVVSRREPRLVVEGRRVSLEDEAARRVAPIPGSGARAEPQALRRASPRRGIERRRTPEAAKTAFATAGAAAMMGVSPPPAGGMSRFSTR